jgi:hypothetical protein
MRAFDRPVRLLRSARTQADAAAQVRIAAAALCTAGFWVPLLSLRTPLFAAVAGVSLLGAGLLLASRPRPRPGAASLVIALSLLPFTVWRVLTPFPGEGLDPSRDLTHIVLRIGPFTWLVLTIPFVVRAALLVRRFPNLPSLTKAPPNQRLKLTARVGGVPRGYRPPPGPGLDARSAAARYSGGSRRAAA